MAGDEEARARAVLAEMQLRISEGSTSALGIGEVVTPEEVRAAFLGLTKQFHPARFGRLSPEVQKLANEVFLGIKGAHDHLLKMLGSSPRASRPGALSSQPAAPHLARGTDRSAGRSSSPVIATPTRTSTPPMGIPVQSRTSTGPLAVGTQRPTTAATPTVGSPQRSTGPVLTQQQRTSTPAAGVRASTPVPPGTQPGVGSGTQPLGRAGTPPTVSRTTTPVPPGTQPGVGTTQPSPRAGTPVPPGAQPGVGNRPSTPQPAVARTTTPPAPTQPLPRVEPFDETAAFRQAAALMEAKDWTAARHALHALATRVPQSKHYRAWLCYARGREAFLNGKPDEAIAEMQRAVQLDPDLAHAKHALAELQRRR